MHICVCACVVVRSYACDVIQCKRVYPIKMCIGLPRQETIGSKVP